MIGDRATHLIDTAMKGLNLRAKIFNNELEKINALRPLDPDSFISPRNDTVISGIKDFVSYLEVYRTMSNATLASLKDSVALDAYTLDHTAFEKYTKALSSLYTDVLKAIEYGKSINIQVKDGQLQFTDKDEYDTYSKIINNIEKTNEKVMKAGNAAQKATADASLAMQKAYGSVKK
jgi:hypothetical protein